MKTILHMSGFLVVALLAVTLPAFAQYDLLLKGGHVIDPKNRINGTMDVAIAAGKVAAVAPDIDPRQAKKVIDLRGLYVTPGIVDIHTHLFATTGIPNAWAGDNSVLPDSFSFRAGVTTMVDAGSAGWRNFEQFRQTVIDRVKTRVLAFVNIVGLGMVSNFLEQEVKEMNPEQVARIAAKHKDVVVGVKSAHYEGRDWVAVDRAVEAGRLANIPVMVDFGNDTRARRMSEVRVETCSRFKSVDASHPSPASRGHARCLLNSGWRVATQSRSRPSRSTCWPRPGRTRRTCTHAERR